jgi:uncharacterized protein (DUF924 family)
MIDEVLAFWFGAGPQKWFAKDPGFDAEIRTRFGVLHAEAAAGAHAEWLATPRGALALIIVLDQFSRNLFREGARAFAQDGPALAISRELVSSGRLRELPPDQRGFALMPLMHAEDLEAQRACIAGFEALAAEGVPGAGQGVDYAKMHAAIVERFGRFPHRNAALGRESTPEELAFLAQPGSRF